MSNNRLYGDRTDFVKLEEKEASDDFKFAVFDGEKLAELPKDELPKPTLQEVLETGNIAEEPIIFSNDTGNDWYIRKIGNNILEFGAIEDEVFVQKVYFSDNTFRILKDGFENAIQSTDLTESRAHTLQNKTGTLAHLDDIPIVTQGTWTGAFIGSTSGSVSTGTQNYLRTGNWVTVEIVCKGIDLTSLVGNVQLTGLPNFSLAVQNGASAVVGHGSNIDYPTGGGNHAKTFMLIIDSGVVSLAFTNDGGDLIPLNSEDIKGGITLYITLTYRIGAI